MAKNYSITFKSLRAGTVYTLNIGGGTGDAVPLKGGAQPFVTQEDDDDDQFTPIRTQSGYLRIVDDGYAADGVTAFDWKDLVPDTDLSRPVTLTAVDAQGNDLGTLWQGFMQAALWQPTGEGIPRAVSVGRSLCKRCRWTEPRAEELRISHQAGIRQCDHCGHPHR